MSQAARALCLGGLWWAGASEAQVLVEASPAAPIRVSVVEVEDGEERAYSVAVFGAGVDAEIMAPGASVELHSREFHERLLELTAPRVDEVWERDPCEAALPFEAEGPEIQPEAPTRSLRFHREAKTAPRAKVAAESSQSLARQKQFKLSKGAEAALSALPEPWTAHRVAPTEALFWRGERPLLRALAQIAPEATLVWTTLGPGRSQPAELASFAYPTNFVLAAPRSAETFEEELDRAVLAGHPGRFLTSYAWPASSCERCQAPLSPAEVAFYGARGLPMTTMKEGEKEHALVTIWPPVASASEEAALKTCFSGLTEREAGLVTVVRDPSASPPSAKIVSGRDDLAACVTPHLEALAATEAPSIRVSFAALDAKKWNALVVSQWKLRLPHTFSEEPGFERGRPLEGGRDFGDGERTPTAFTEGVNAFRVRAEVAHPWAGEIACAAPQRGRFGPAPSGKKPSPTKKSAAKGTTLKADLREGSLEPFSLAGSGVDRPSAPPGSSAAPASSGSAPAAQSEAPASASESPRGPMTEPASGGCACRTDSAAGASSSWAPLRAWMLLFGALCLLVRRTARSN